MALTEVASGTFTPASTAENTLATDTTGGVYIFKVDATNMVNGDEIVLRVYDMVLAGGTLAVVYYAAYRHGQAEDVKHSPPVPALHSCRATLAQTAGTNRAYPWALLKQA